MNLEKNEILNKKWIFSFKNSNINLESNTFEFGPLSTYKVYSLLKNIFSHSSILIDHRNLLIKDKESDVHYQPKILYDILEATFKCEENNKLLLKNILLDNTSYSDEDTTLGRISNNFKLFNMKEESKAEQEQANIIKFENKENISLNVINK